ncbi:class I adenylate-forming enzyme family protein [Ruegeria atlantica]|uniref:class I adenylate-forming enzyme family protein n=1 Tax=Ruegeria atlantica TaxID=81569 RepID=UPI00147CE3EA|nr:class I adenylate-forming enzyme family protein [Ruegeria atlantica]
MPISGPELEGPAPLHDLLGHAASDMHDDTALVSGISVWTWQPLKQQIETLAAHMLALGLQPGDRVASLVPNCGELLVHYLACLKAGLVVVPLNYRYTATNIDYALKVSEAQIMLFHAERFEDLEASEQAHQLSLGRNSVGGPVQGARSFEELMHLDPPAAMMPEPDLNALAFIFFTSGSTGTPKGVMHSIRSFGAITASFAQAMCLTNEDVVFPGGSISHVGGLSTAFAGLLVRAPVILDRRFDGDVVLPLLRKWRPTVLVALPAALIALQQDHNAKRADFSSLRLCITGGDKFPVNLEKGFSSLTGLEIKETYGLTEAADCLFDPPNKETKPGSVGIVCPGFSMSVRDSDGNEVEEGDLWLSGDPMFLGYWKDPKATAEAVQDGCFNTEDIMRVDADGYFWFVGRTKQIIVHDGSNIAPQEVEEAVMAHPAIELAGVVGVHDTVHGENVWAYASVKDGVATPRSKDVVDLARKKIGYKAPEVVIFLDRIPLNATGKVDRLALKKLAAERLSAACAD